MKISVFENGKVVIREMTQEEINKSKPTPQMQAITYKQYLTDTDYIVLKIAEAQVEGDNAKVDELKQTYAEQLTKRSEYRKLLNEIE